MTTNAFFKRKKKTKTLEVPQSLPLKAKQFKKIMTRPIKLCTKNPCCAFVIVNVERSEGKRNKLGSRLPG